MRIRRLILFFEKRPWGWFLKLISTPFFWVKIILVKKGHRTSLQRHDERIEYHVGIQLIDKEIAHRMGRGIYLEFAFGKPKESDIVRLKDDYGRE